MWPLSASLRVALVWLTALMVLVAGSPSISCRCPDGRRKLFCLHSAVPSRADCCAISCCPTPPDGERACCQSHRQESGARMESTGCSKELTPPTLVVANDSSHGDNAGAHSVALPPLSALDPILVLPGVVDGPLTRPAPHPSPPFDRIIALCHFII